jgi:bifunctional UDP-N-acetylglucosamine pyrophosphorylase/glucosamine-1-phosphate N-acetyltransferase
MEKTMTVQRPLACVILAAGKGTRMKSAKSKVLHEIANRPMIGWVMEALKPLAPQKIVTVIGNGMDDLKKYVTPHETVIQTDQRGTGDAVRAALPALKDFNGDVLIVLGDMPLIASDTLKNLISAGQRTGLAVLGADFETPPAFGRFVMNTDGTLAKIVEDKDCTAEEKKITRCNLGAWLVDAEHLKKWIPRITPNNAQKEYYLTDLPMIAAQDGVKTHVAFVSDISEAQGANSRMELAALEKTVQQKLRQRAMENGATLLDPDTVYFSHDTVLGRDVLIEQGVVFGLNVRVADDVHIRAYSYLEGATIESGAVVGPFARLRPHTVIGKDSKIGNFVEIKNAMLGEGVKAAHLAYIGDADVGDQVNFSCGAITVNYDGVNKHRTLIGNGAMVGSNVNLIAPITVGKNAYIAAGSTIDENVPPEALAIARERVTIKKERAKGRTKKHG